MNRQYTLLVYFAMGIVASEQYVHVCYEEIGCFEAAKGATNFSHHVFAPASPKDISPSFRLYTPSTEAPNFDRFQNIDYFNLETSLKLIKIDPSKDLYVAIHGFKGSEERSHWMFPLAKGLLKRDANVILVYWPKGALILNYYQAAANTRVLGAMIARILLELEKSGLTSLAKTTITGHSLGAHTAGFAGELIPGLFRIIGLDPAGPLFSGPSVAPGARLDPTDAKFVAAIHTNGADLLKGNFGTLLPMGHIDFYPNGGQFQRGCRPQVARAIYDLLHVTDAETLREDMACNHNRAAWLLSDIVERTTDSGDRCSFAMFACNDPKDWQVGQCTKCADGQCPQLTMDLGRKTDKLNFGSYFFDTRSDNLTAGGYCGDTYSWTVSSASSTKGTVYIEASVAGQSSKMTWISGNLSNKQTFSGFAVLPWRTRIDHVTVTYTKKNNIFPFLRGQDSWTIDSFSLESLDSSRGKTSFHIDNITFQSGIPEELKLSK